MGCEMVLCYCVAYVVLARRHWLMRCATKQCLRLIMHSFKKSIASYSVVYQNIYFKMSQCLISRVGNGGKRRANMEPCPCLPSFPPSLHFPSFPLCFFPLLGLSFLPQIQPECLGSAVSSPAGTGVVAQLTNSF